MANYVITTTKTVSTNQDPSHSRKFGEIIMSQYHSDFNLKPSL